MARALVALRGLEQHSGTSPWDVTPTQLRSWLIDAPTLGGAAFNLRTVRPFLRWCVTEGIIDADPTKGVRAKAPEEPQTTATDDQISEMLRASRQSPRDHAIVALLVATGARRSEVGLLTYADLADFIDSGCVRISRSKTQARIARVDATAERAVRRWLRGAKPHDVWGVTDGPRLVTRVVDRYSHDELSPHAIRRWFVTTVARRGMSAASIGRQLGWSPSTTNIMIGVYTKATASDLLEDEYRRVMQSR